MKTEYQKEYQRLCEICVGNSVNAASALLKSAGLEYKIRITTIDDKPCLTTKDYCRNRINVMIKDNIIAAISGIG